MNQYISENGIILPHQQLFIQVPIEFIRNPKFTINEKILYQYIWTFGITHKVAFPSQELISKDLGMSKPTLRKTMDSLEKKNGLLRIQQVFEGTKGKTTCLYYLGEITKDGSFSNKYLKTVLDIYPDKVKYIPKNK